MSKSDREWLSSHTKFSLGLSVDEIEALARQRDELLAACKDLLTAVPTSNDMRLLHVAAFNRTTTDYDDLDDLKDRVRGAIAATGQGDEPCQRQ